MALLPTRSPRVQTTSPQLLSVKSLFFIVALVVMVLLAIYTMRGNDNEDMWPNELYICLARDKNANGRYVATGGSHDAPAYRSVQSNVRNNNISC
jgi:hypothetical protein